jgi:hypothetical protein
MRRDRRVSLGRHSRRPRACLLPGPRDQDPRNHLLARGRAALRDHRVPPSHRLRTGSRLVAHHVPHRPPRSTCRPRHVRAVRHPRTCALVRGRRSPGPVLQDHLPDQPIARRQGIARRCQSQRHHPRRYEPPRRRCCLETQGSIHHRQAARDPLVWRRRGRHRRQTPLARCPSRPSMKRTGWIGSVRISSPKMGRTAPPSPTRIIVAWPRTRRALFRRPSRSAIA